MKITRIQLWRVAMPLISPWRTAYGEDHVIHSVLCRLESGSLVGWGESTPLAAPCYSPEWGGGVFAVARQWFAPQLLGQELPTPEALQQRLGFFKGNSFAKALFDNAWWSLKACETGRPLHALLAERAEGTAKQRISVGADFGVADSTDELLTDIGSAISDGFPRIKLKYRPGWDLAMLREVRRQFPEHTFHIDCNSGYRLADLDMFRQIDELNLAMIEQPLAYDDLHEHAQLQAAIKTPICLDETVSHPQRAKQAIELGSCRFVNIKPGRIGGLTNAVAVHNMCRRAGIPCWVGGMLESAVGVSHCIALASLENFTYPADIFPSERYYREDLADPPIRLQKDEHGAPFVTPLAQLPEPNAKRLEQLAEEYAEIV